MKDSYLAQFYGKSQNYTDIPNKWYKEYNVKKGLRNEDGTGVLVGLTKIGNVVGYERIPGGGLKPIPGNCSIEAMMWKTFPTPSSRKNVSASKKWLICYSPVVCRTRKNWLRSAN